MAGAGIVHNIPILMEGASYAEALMITIIIGVICGPQKNMQQTQLSSQNYIIIMRLRLALVQQQCPPCLPSYGKIL